MPSRRTFLAGAAATGGVAAAERLVVPGELVWPEVWNGWTSALTVCLNAAGVACDAADVAGMTGHAFHLACSPKVSLHGPYAFDFGECIAGLHQLGRSVLCFHGGPFSRPEEAGAQHDYLRDLVRAELRGGRPMLVMGVYVPEAGVIYGLEGDDYLVIGWGRRGRIQYQRLESYGHFLLAFPLPTIERMPNADQRAVANAAMRLERPQTEPGYASGQAAWPTWIAALEGERASARGHAYCCHNFAGLRTLAAEWLGRVARRNPDAAEPLDEAARAMAAVRDALRRLAALFPFPPGEELRDAGRRADAIAALTEAQEAEGAALAELRAALATDWAAPLYA